MKKTKKLESLHNSLHLFNRKPAKLLHGGGIRLWGDKSTYWCTVHNQLCHHPEKDTLTAAI